MEAEDIRRLLEKYEAAETSLEEETILEEYFRKETNIPEEWMPYRLMFDWKNSVHSAHVSESFSNRLKAKIESSVQTPPASLKTKFFTLNPIARWGVAASLMIAFGFWFLMQEKAEIQSEPIYTLEETFDSPEDAYKQTMEALAFVSTKMNKGRQKASESLGKLKRLDDVIPN